MKKEKQTPQNYLSLWEGRGKLPYTLQNDYLFKIVMESDERILRALLCSLLNLKEEEIISIRIMNPIMLGSKNDDKMTMLDIRVIFT